MLPGLALQAQQYKSIFSLGKDIGHEKPECVQAFWPLLRKAFIKDDHMQVAKTRRVSLYRVI